LFCGGLFASDADRSVAESVARMREGLEKQRTSVMRQTGVVTTGSFFTTPWTDAPAAPVAPVAQAAVWGNCDPLPASELRRLVAEAAPEGISPMLVHAVIRRESGGRPCAVSPKGAQGLMQLMPATQSELGVRNPFEPADNINAGARYLKQLLGRYNANLRLALAAYNAGPQRVAPGGEIPSIPETQAYVAAIMEDLQDEDLQDASGLAIQ
jgi:soluble lytic murein transglycosylase-like protein